MVNFPPFFTTETKVCDFLFTFLHTRPLLKMGHIKGEQVPLRADPFQKGSKTIIKERVASLEIVSIPF